MPVPMLTSTDPEFEANAASLALRRQRAQGLEAAKSEAVRRRVDEIVQAVRERGDEAVLEFTERFDGCRLSADRMRVGEDETEAAMRAIEPGLLQALRAAAGRIRRFQEAVLLRDPAPLEEDGRTVGLSYRPVDCAGICVPGASASLASSVLMSVIPASVAGVGRIVVITPPGRDGTVSADRLAAARVAGAHEVYRVFGAQGVAALAFGTETIPAVDFIAGPGNAYVTMAKKAVFGQVGIDMLAGPSEVAIIADGSARPDWVAAEMLAQAEHPAGSATLLTPEETVGRATTRALERQLGSLAEPDEARRNLDQLGAVIVAPTLEDCAEITNRLAPEHLVIMTRQPERVCGMVRHAGAIFLGPHAPVAAGDYIAGPSHCLPTGTTARFSAGLTANTFLRSASIIRYSREALAEDADRICRMAEAEGLDAHARSVRIRLEG